MYKERHSTAIFCVFVTKSYTIALCSSNCQSIPEIEMTYRQQKKKRKTQTNIFLHNKKYWNNIEPTNPNACPNTH